MSKANEPKYPNRESFFSLKFVRLLVKTAIANDIGANAFALLCVIASTEDEKRYRGAVTYHNNQLIPLIGVKSWDALSRARHLAVESGWLHYEAPPRGHKRPGKYWVTIPAGLDDAESIRTHADSSSTTVRRASAPERTVTSSHSGEDPHQSGSTPEHSSLTLTLKDPIPMSSYLKLRFGPDDMELAEWMFGKIQSLYPDHKRPNFDKWANEIRLTRERDGRSPHEIREVFSWANSDDFWQANVLCPANLRKQFDRLKAQSLRKGTTIGKLHAGPGQRFDPNTPAARF